jgi:hypothetical protein
MSCFPECIDACIYTVLVPVSSVFDPSGGDRVTAAFSGERRGRGEGVKGPATGEVQRGNAWAVRAASLRVPAWRGSGVDRLAGRFPGRRAVESGAADGGPVRVGGEGERGSGAVAPPCGRALCPAS